MIKFLEKCFTFHKTHPVVLFFNLRVFEDRVVDIGLFVTRTTKRLPVKLEIRAFFVAIVVRIVKKNCERIKITMKKHDKMPK